MIEPLGVHHVSLNVRDTAESVAFYTGALGLTVRDDRPDFSFGGAWLDLGEQQVHLLEIDVPDDVGQHFAIQVSDLAGAVDELRSKGVAVTEPSVVGTGQQSFLHDPSGNRIELHQPAT